MPVTPDDIENLAIELGRRSDETSYRCAASRYYYSAYHKCRNLADTIDEPEYSDSGMHSSLITKLTRKKVASDSREFDMKIRSIGHLLQAAKDIRTNADYELNYDFEKHNMDEIKGMLDRLNDKLSELNGHFEN